MMYVYRNLNAFDGHFESPCSDSQGKLFIAITVEEPLIVGPAMTAELFIGFSGNVRCKRVHTLPLTMMCT